MCLRQTNTPEQAPGLLGGVALRVVPAVAACGRRQSPEVAEQLAADTAHLLGEHEELQAEGRGLGMHTVGAADARRVLELHRPATQLLLGQDAQPLPALVLDRGGVGAGPRRGPARRPGPQVLRQRRLHTRLGQVAAEAALIILRHHGALRAQRVDRVLRFQ